MAKMIYSYEDDCHNQITVRAGSDGQVAITVFAKRLGCVAMVELPEAAKADLLKALSAPAGQRVEGSAESVGE